MRAQAHELPLELLKVREVVHVDLCDDTIMHASDYKDNTDPKKWHSAKTGRGPLLQSDWVHTVQPVMCAYKLVTIEFKWWGLQGRIKKFAGSVGERAYTCAHREHSPAQAYLRLFGKFHRELICWMDEWIELNMNDIRQLEEKIKVELDERRRRGSICGMKPE